MAEPLAIFSRQVTMQLHIAFYVAGVGFAAVADYDGVSLMGLRTDVTFVVEVLLSKLWFGFVLESDFLYLYSLAV